MIWQFRMGALVLGMICAGNMKGQAVRQVQADTIKRNQAAALPKAPVIKPKKPKPITREFSVGAALHTDGWGVFVNKGWVRSDDSRNSDKFYNVRFAQIELTEHKHVKEIKGTNSALSMSTNDKPKPFIYGKINNFYALKLGYGNRRMIAGKPEPGTISIHWLYMGGLSAGMLKPYYIDAYVLQDNPKRYVRENIRYSEENREDFTKQENIVGSSGWSKGLNEIKFIPGLHAKTGLHFDFAASAKTKLALEIGVSGELYTQKIELMANQTAYPYMLNAYLSLQFGKRY